MKQKNIGPIVAVMLLFSLWGIIYNHSILSPSPVSAHEAKLIPLSQPVAGNDTYALYNDQTLTVIAGSDPPGLLHNDLDYGNNPTLKVKNSPIKGQVVQINNDGSFTYQPNSGVSGTDTFTYELTNNDTGETDEAIVTLEFRSVFFREDTNEIKKGECVNFTWFVEGDIKRIEFEIFDDNKNPYLVDIPSGDRRECPVQDTRYQLIVRWLDGSTDKNEKIDIKVDESSSSSSSSGGGSTTTVVVEGTVAPVGPFFLVTPVLITNAPGLAIVPEQATPVPSSASAGGTANFAAPKPTGVLESVSALPETGSLPSFNEAPRPRQAVIRPEAGSITAQPPNSDNLWLRPVFRMGLLLGTVLVGLTLLARFLRQPD